MPKARTATLKVRHQRACINYPRGALESLDGCTCKPSYFTEHRDARGNKVRGPHVRDRRVANQALTKVQFELDSGRAEVGPQRGRVSTFNGWTDEFLQILEVDKRSRPDTLRKYRDTFAYARTIIGSLEIDEITITELRLVVREIRKTGAADATLHTHLKNLRATLNAAVEEGVARGNPLTAKFIRDLRLVIPNEVLSYSDAELVRLLAQLQLNLEAKRVGPKATNVYLYAVRGLLVTGARVGELAAADWDDLDLTNGRLRIWRSWDPAGGFGPPKDGDERTVRLFRQPDDPLAPATPELIDGVALFERWTQLCGIRPGDMPLFAPARGERLNTGYLTRLVREACDKAKIPLEVRGRHRKPLHALRASYSRLSREAGFPTYLRQANLGHSTPDLSDATYGRVSEEQLDAAARRAV